MSVFSGQTRQDGGFGNRGNAEHGTKHVLHVGALTPQSFRQMAGDIWSVDGYRISKTHSRKTLRPNFHQIACWPVRDPAYIHIQSFKRLWCPWFASFKRKAQTDVKSQVLLCLCPAFGLPNFSADLVLTTMDRNFRNFKTTKCTSNWTSRSWRCKLARFCFCSWTTALAKSYRFEELTELSN